MKGRLAPHLLTITRTARPVCGSPPPVSQETGVWMPLHFADSNVNLVTNDAGDSITGTGEYKVCAVRVESAGVA